MIAEYFLILRKLACSKRTQKHQYFQVVLLSSVSYDKVSDSAEE